MTPVDIRLQLAHNSPAIVADPKERRFVAMATRVDNPDFGCALHVSGDGGRTWVPTRPFERLPKGAEKCYAPEIAFDARGTLHYLFVGLRGAGNSPMGAFLVSSSDRGRTFSAPRRVLGPERYMVRLAIDRGRGERGRIHLVWLQTSADPPLGGLPQPPNPIMAAHSDDGGRTFSTPVQVSDARRLRAIAPAVAVGRDGRLHVLYYDLQDDARDYQGLEGPAWEGTWSLVLATSTDGGRRFDRGVTVDDDVRPVDRVMLVFTMPPPSLAAGDDGRLFVAWHDARHGDWDVLLRASSDGGRTWGPVVRLNDDRKGNGRHQYLPRLAVSPDGRLDAVFYDRRLDPRNVRNHVFLTSSGDGGLTFAPNLRLTTESSNHRVGVQYPGIPSARGQFEHGSRLALLAERRGTVAAWTESRHAEQGDSRQEVWAARVEVEGGGGGSPWRPALMGLAAAAVAGAGAALWWRRRSRRAPPS